MIVVLSVDRGALRRIISADDLTTALDQDRLKDDLADDAFAITEAGFGQLALVSVAVTPKAVYRIDSVPHSIVLRLLNHAVRSSTKVRSSDRDTIIRQLATLLSEGVPHRVYKFDIKSFFDTVDTAALSAKMSLDQRVPRSFSNLLTGYLDRLRALGVEGLPRGISLSATLAEYAMQEFDAYISRLPEVYYYARYVDDIIIITGAREPQKTFVRKIRNCLPFSLKFNAAKSAVLDVPVQRNSTGAAVVGDFDYLGYNIAVHETFRLDRKFVRKVDIAISSKKIRRLKTRVCCAIAKFISDGNRGDLNRRLQLLTGNYNVRDFSSGRVRNVGLYCNYRRVNKLRGLEQLDVFLRSVVLGKQSDLSRRFAAKLALKERRSLLVFSFSSGFQRQIFYNFSAVEIATLTRCWLNA